MQQPNAHDGQSRPYARLNTSLQYFLAGSSQYYAITTASNHTLRLSDTHYAYHAPSPNAAWSQRQPIAARYIVAAQHVLWVVDSPGQELVQSPVLSVKTIIDEGWWLAWRSLLECCTCAMLHCSQCPYTLYGRKLTCAYTCMSLCAMGVHMTQQQS
jgi:hypothetical protein